MKNLCILKLNNLTNRNNEAIIENPLRRKGMRLMSGFFFVLLCFLATYQMQAQEQKNIEIKGVVLDDQSEPISASVVLEGTQIGVVTNEDGTFKFPEKLKKGDVLIVNSMGFETKRVEVKDANSAAEIAMALELGTEIIIVGDVAKKKAFSSKKE